MPAFARKELIDEAEVHVYHCYIRCNHAEFWLGFDRKANADFSHRKEWILCKLKELAQAFAIDVCKFAILDNHLHYMLRNRPDIVAEWSDAHVLSRARQAFPSFFEKLGIGPRTREIPLAISRNKELVAEMRARLSSISWLLRQLHSHVSRRANEEIDRLGHFFSSRFKSQRLDDDFAIFSCSVYMDLNEIRAGIADRPERAKNSSISLRIQAAIERQKRRLKRARKLDGFLAPLYVEGDHKLYDAARLGHRASNLGFLEMPLERYVEIVDLAGRSLREGCRGRIPPQLLPILERVGLSFDALLDIAQNFSRCRSIVATPTRLMEIARVQGKRTIQGISYLRSLFTSPCQATTSS